MIRHDGSTWTPPERSLFQCNCGSKDVRLETESRNVLMCCEACLETYSFDIFEFIQLLLEEAGVSEFTLGAQIKVTDFHSAVLDMEDVPDKDGEPQ